MISTSISRKQPSDSDVDGTLLLGALLGSLTIFSIQALIFSTQFRPDEVYYLVQIRSFFYEHFGRSLAIGELRILFYVLSVGLTLVAWLSGLLTTKTTCIALLWPLLVSLYSRVHIETFVYPLALIRIDKSIKFDFFIVLFLFLFLYLTGEQNIIPMLIFRALLIASKLRLAYIASAALILISIILGVIIESGAAQSVPVIGESLARFEWTREVANPEFSVPETLGVFFSSFHFFTTHYHFWQVDFAFTILLLAFFGFRIFALEQEAKSALVKSLFILFAILLSITLVTHVFQNARYYLFFIPILSIFLKRRDMLPLFMFGTAHSLAKAVEPILFAQET